MTESTGTLARALREVTSLLDALSADIGDEERARALLASLGLALPEALPSLFGLRESLSRVRTAADEYQAAVDSAGEDSAEATAKLVALSTATAAAFADLLALGPQLADDLAAYPELDVPLLVERLAEWALVTYLRSRFPLAYNVMVLFGAVDPEVHGDEGAGTEPYVRPVLRWSRLKLAVKDPAELLTQVYGWATPGFDAQAVLRRMYYVLLSAGLGPSLVQAEQDAGDGADGVLELLLPLFADTGQAGALEIGLALAGLPATSAGDDAGLALLPYAIGAVTAEFEPTPGLRVTLSGAFEGEGGVGVAVRPPLTFALIGTTDVDARISLTVEWGRADGTPFVLFSQPPWFTMQLAGIRFEIEAVIDLARGAIVSGRLLAVGGRLTISPGEGDGFLKSVLPPEGIVSDFELGIAFSPELGVRFVGSAGFEVTLPVHLSLGGVLTVETILVGVRAGQGGVTTEVSATFEVALGPVRAAVERMGLGIALTAPAEGGNLGPVAAAAAFKPPEGAGLAINAGPVVGGGYLSFRPSEASYAGILQLEFKGIALKAVGLITTRMPDGSDGFSLLLIISAEFTPIQLGYGFTLNGVGGLIGINRTAALDVLRAGIKARTLDSIMFPRDPVANAAKLISDLSAVFPPAAGRFVLGPMARLGWGSPTLLTLDLGLLLELPAPIRLAVMGRLRMALPADEAAVVIINMDVLGVIDFGRGEVSIDATLYDSRIAAFALTGDMALRAGWGEQPGFALSAGGFHPRFQPPPGFPALGRLALSLANGDNPRLRLECYLALTSNTAQFGARLELYAAAFGFTLEGVLAFDALFQFEPFSLMIDIVGAVALKQGSRVLLALTVALSLTGPTPWYATGRATFQLLFFSAEISFEIRLGDEPPPPLPPPVDVEPLVEAALADPRNWSAQLPPEGQSLVTLREIPVGKGELLMHPLSSPAVTQKVAPLGRTLERFGASRVTGATRLDITSLRMGDAEAETDPILEQFAPAQFADLSDDAKLDAPSFERWEAGRRVRPSGIGRDTCPPIEASLAPTTIVMDQPETPADALLAPHPRVAATAAAAHAPIRRSGSLRFAAAPLELGVS